MAHTRPTTRSALLSSCLLVVLAALAFLAPPASASAPNADADTDIICHTSDPNDCYPRIFQPTDEFQTVREDQELPNGLHVRMNIWTGTKEAKINVPDERDPALEGLPVDQAVVVVDPQTEDAPKVPKGAPAYDTVGKVKGPQQDAQSFLDAMRMLKSGTIESDREFDSSLEALQDISHDMYYGLKTAEDTEVVKALFCLMEQQDARAVDGATPRDQQAAAILASALSNNPPALKEMAKHWTDILSTTCPNTDAPLSERLYASFVPPNPEQLAAPEARTAAAKAKAKVSAVNGLIRDDAIRRAFVVNGGMERLLEILLPEGKEWSSAQRRVGQLVLDTFLDEDMGAFIGEWPTTPRIADGACRAGAQAAQSGCWDRHVERIAAANRKDKEHWSHDLSRKLASARKAGASAERSEL